MNRVYRLIWNRALQCLQVVSELSRANRGGTLSCATRVCTHRRAVLAMALSAALLGTVATPVLAVVRGSDGQGGRNGSAEDGAPVGGAGGTGSLPGANDGEAGASTGTSPYASGGTGGGLANGGFGTGGSGGGVHDDIGGGGGGGGGGLAVHADATATSSAGIAGGHGGSGGVGGALGSGGGGGGGAGVLIDAGVVFTSAYDVSGGYGGSGDNTGFGKDASGNGGAGGDAVIGKDGSAFTNLSGDLHIRGGSGGDGHVGGAGGIAFEGGSHVHFVNGGAAVGLIDGGHGGEGFTFGDDKGIGGAGATAVVLGAGSAAVNNSNGVIVGGTGGYGFIKGAGGIGLALGDAGVLTNHGSIGGGDAAIYCAADCVEAAGGSGVVLDGSASMTNSNAAGGASTARVVGGKGTLGWNRGGGGGNGIDLLGTGGALLNSDGAQVVGGIGGDTSTLTGSGGAGGIGVFMDAGSTVVNRTGAAIAGGEGNNGSSIGGAGGVGVVLAAKASLENSAGVTGGRGGLGQSGMVGGTRGTGGKGGAGVTLAAGATLKNSGENGSISGGAGGSSGPEGVGGAGGVGVRMADAAVFTNEALVAGGEGALGSAAGVVSGGAGGDGIAGGSGAHLDNRGHILGGEGGRDGTASADSADGGAGAVGGDGVRLGDDARVINAAGAGIAGGRGGHGGVYVGAGNQGGTGLALGERATVTNAGAITGGDGGTGTHFQQTRTDGGRGGDALSLVDGTVVNQGSGATLTGGMGGSNVDGGHSAAAGDGVVIHGGMVSNLDGALIAGGDGAANRILGLSGGAAGTGVVADGNVHVLNASLISGGLPNGDAGATRGDAIRFAGGGNRLSLENGYAFAGNVVSTSGAAHGGDVLELGGDSRADGGRGDGLLKVSGIADASPAPYAAASGPAYVGFQRFEKTGSSTWTLIGTDHHVTTWQVTGGYLKGDATAMQGAIELAPADGAHVGVIFDQGSANANSPARASFAAVVSGAGSLAKTGDGSLILTGDNTYAGGTTIEQGTLQIGNGGREGSVTGDIVDNGTLAFDRSDAIAFGGVISGTGGVEYRGIGNVTVSGANSYSGGTTLEAGTVTVASRDALGTGQVRMSSQAALAFASSGIALDNAFVFAGQQTTTVKADATNVLSGILSDAGVNMTGALMLDGGGTLVLNGTNTYTGGTMVHAGTLAIGDADHPDARVAGDVQVDAAGTLRGHGHIAGDVVNAGVVWPGGSVGVLAVQGNYTQDATGGLRVDVTPGGASQLQVGQAAHLAGALDLVYAPGTYSEASYTLVTAHNVSGTFVDTKASGDVPKGLQTGLVYDASHVDLVLSAGATSAPPPSAPPPSSPTTPPASPPPPTTPTRITPRDSAHYANRIQVIDMAQQRSQLAVLDELASSQAVRCDQVNIPSITRGTCGSGLWVQATGSSQTLAGSNGLHSEGSGLQVGADRSVGEAGARLGTTLGAERINSSDAGSGHGHTDLFHAGVYASASIGPLQFDGLLDAGRQRVQVSRPTGVGQALADPDGRSSGAAMQLAWPVGGMQWRLVPRAGVLYRHQILDGFSEKVASTDPLAPTFGISAGRSRYNSLQPYVALAFSRMFEVGQVRYVPSIDAGLWREQRDQVTVVDGRASDGTRFALAGIAPGRTITRLRAGVTASSGKRWGVALMYRGLFADQLHDNAATFTLTRRW